MGLRDRARGADNKLAAALGGKTAQMTKPSDAERMLGLVGGFSPFDSLGDVGLLNVLLSLAAFRASSSPVTAGRQTVMPQE